MRATKFCSRQAPVAHAPFFMCALDAQLHRPEWPWRQRRALLGRLRHDLELLHGKRLLPMAGAEAIGAGIAASDNDHTFASRQNLSSRIDGVAQIAAVLLWQVIHREMDSFQLASGDI